MFTVALDRYFGLCCRSAARKAVCCTVILALFWLATLPALACKYTVRDVAFVEMGHSQYRLHLYVDAETPAEYVDSVQASAAQSLTDSNIHLDVMTVDQNLSDENIERLRTLEIDAYPAAVLISPKGRLKQIDLPKVGNADAEAMSQSLDTLVRSPKRQELLTLLSTAHSIVLIIEGNDQAQNQQAKTMAENAIERIVATFPELPKAIDGPPVLMSLSPTEAQAEAMLLWGLGVDLDDPNVTQIAMVFGRGRNLGSVFEMSRTTEQDLLRTLAVVGLDCECDLDRSWMQTPMIPHVWTEADEFRAAQDLGFDPGHPLVKVEISRMLSRGPTAPGPNHQVDSDIILPGLQIIELDFGDEEEEGEASEIASSPTNEPNTAASETAETSSPEFLKTEANATDVTPAPAKKEVATQAPVDEEPPVESGTDRMLATTLLGLAALGLLGGGFILFSGRRN